MVWLWDCRKRHASSRLGACNIARISEETSCFISRFGTCDCEFCCRWNWQRCHFTLGKTDFLAAFKPLWASLVINSMPWRPRSTSELKKSRQCPLASDNETDTPIILRRPATDWRICCRSKCRKCGGLLLMVVTTLHSAMLAEAITSSVLQAASPLSTLSRGYSLLCRPK